MNRRERRYWRDYAQQVRRTVLRAVKGMRHASSDAAWLIEQLVEKYSKAEDSGWQRKDG